MERPSDSLPRTFRFERDTFAFANELIWKYHFEPETKAMRVCWTQPPPTYSHRCFVVARSARQFFYHARFDPGLPRATPGECRRLIREVVSRDPRKASPESERLVIPGYDGLRKFSQAHEPLLKAECGGPWESYFVRSHWRMVFPISERHQEHTAAQLRQGVLAGRAPLVHIFRFPKVIINHAILLFAVTESERGIRFDAYDPNIPDQAVELNYDADRRRFDFPATCYWMGGTLKVVQTFCGGLY